MSIEKTQFTKTYPLQALYEKTGKKIFQTPQGAVAYEATRYAHVVAGDPIVVTNGCLTTLMSDFDKYSKERDKVVCGYYFSEEFKKSSDKKFITLGTSGFLKLQTFDTKGPERKYVRRALNFGNNKNYSFKEIPQSKKGSYLSRVKKLESQWFSKKKRPRIGFLLSRAKLQYRLSHYERWFVVENDLGHLGAFVSVVPYNDNKNYYIDHMFYNPEQGSRMSLDFLLAQLILMLKNQKVEELYFGLNAFNNRNPKYLLEWGLSFLWRSSLVYNARGVYFFKSKFFDLEVPRYIMLDQQKSLLKQYAALGAVTFMH